VKLRQPDSWSTFLPILSLIASCSAPPTTSSNYWPAPSTANTAQNSESNITSGQTAASPGPGAADSGATGATGQTSEAGTWHSPSQPSPTEDAAPHVVADAAAPSTWPPASDASAGVPASDSGSSSSSSLYPPTTETAQDFCNEYQMYCGFGGSMRYADMATCVMNYNTNTGQQGCYVYHLHAAIAGTATLCTSPPTQMCFDIHCPHATGQGGYCN